jgi:hypothetical protein
LGLGQAPHNAAHFLEVATLSLTDLGITDTSALPVFFVALHDLLISCSLVYTAFESLLTNCTKFRT